MEALHIRRKKGQEGPSNTSSPSFHQLKKTLKQTTKHGKTERRSGRSVSGASCAALRPQPDHKQTNAFFKPGVKEVPCARWRDVFHGDKKGLACGLKNHTVDLQPYNEPTGADSSTLGRLIP